MLISQVFKLGFKNKNKGKNDKEASKDDEKKSDIKINHRIKSLPSKDEKPPNSKNKNGLFKKKHASLPPKLEIVRVEDNNDLTTSKNQNSGKSLWRYQFTAEELASFLLTPREIERQEVINELVNTEEDYINDLLILKKLYVDPMKNSTYVDKDSYEDIFLNLNDLLNLHQFMFAELKERVKEQWPLVNQICDILMGWLKEFHIYSDYLSKQNQANLAFDKLIANNKKFNMFIKAQSLLPQSKGQDLKSYLLKPFQRLSKYPLLLKNLLEVSSSGTVDFLNAVRCKHAFEGLITRISEDKFRLEHGKTLNAWDDKIGSLMKFRLTDPRRKFYIDGKLFNIKMEINNQNKSKQNYYFALFGDLLAYLPEEFRYGLSKFQILSSYHPSTVLCKVLDVKDISQEGYTNSFKLITIDSKTTKLVLEADSSETKLRWMEHLRLSIPTHTGF